MKFGKEFKAQMVPEWQEKYMDYNSLKNLLKDLQRFQQKNQRPPTASFRLQRKLTLIRAFSGLNHPATPTPADVESQDRLMMNSSGVGGGGGSVGCEFMSPVPESGKGEIAALYFKRLDEELNKVVQFYKSKVEEVMNEASVLNKQMDALIAFRVKVRDPTGFADTSIEMARLSTDVANSTAALAATTPSSARSKLSGNQSILSHGP